MELLKKFMFRTKMDVQKSAYIWNMAAGLFSALESFLFSIIVTRTVGLSDAGIVTIGFAVGNLMATIGKYGVRTFQVTDIKRKYSFSDYFSARLITILMMAVINGSYMVWCFHAKGYSAYKSAIILMLCARFMLEAFEDVFAGECQKNGRLDVSSRIFVIRSAGFTAVFAVALFFSKALMVAMVCGLIFIVFVEIIMLKLLMDAMGMLPRWTGVRCIKGILIKCFSLCLSAFFFFYMTNAPKYAIDTVMNDEVQACYSFIAFPVFAIELMNNFIYQPVLVSLAADWNASLFSKVKIRIYKQLAIILGLTAFSVAGGALCGIPVLSAVFSTDLTQYKSEMLLLLMSGGLLAVIGYLSTILVTMRRSVLMIYGYVVAFFASVCFYTPVIVKYGVMGGVLLYGFLCFLFALYEYLAICYIIRACIKKVEI